MVSNKERYARMNSNDFLNLVEARGVGLFGDGLHFYRLIGEILIGSRVVDSDETLTDSKKLTLYGVAYRRAKKDDTR